VKIEMVSKEFDDDIGEVVFLRLFRGLRKEMVEVVVAEVKMARGLLERR
jgi:hypothetical protein